MSRSLKKRARVQSRRDRFIDRGGDAFMPLSRIREIRWEEAVTRSRIKREGGGEVTFRHVHFHCPTGCCLGTPVPDVHSQTKASDDEQL